MTDMMVKIMVEFLDILGTATKEMKQSRLSEVILLLRLLGAHVCSEIFLKKVAGITKLDDGLKKLDKMTNEEALMASAEVLRVAHDIDQKVQGVGTQVKDVYEKVQGVNKDVQGVGVQVKEAATETKLLMRQIPDDVNRSSSVLSSPTVKYITRSQGSNCERALENGSLLRIHPQITTSHAISNTRERRSGSVTATSLRNGR